jgi:sterol desaturase/sphingolipid hydroxylase (fatty acid hydroxylase superfamily)
VTDFLATYALLLGIIWLRYGLVAGAAHGFLWGQREERVRAFKLAKARPTRKAVWREARTSTLVSLIYAAPAAWLYFSWERGGTAIYSGTPGSLAGWLYLPVSVLLYLALHDAYFYWTHRAMHHPALYKATHHTHHVSKQPTPWASFAFSPWEALISAWFVPALAFVLPIHIGAFALMLTVATAQAVFNHSGWEVFPRRFLDGPVGRHLITARHHNLHHTRFARNYGLYFRWWDRLCGTDDMSGDPMAHREAVAAVAASR